MKFFFELFSPIVGHLWLFQKNDNCLGGGGGGWACLDLTEPLSQDLYLCTCKLNVIMFNICFYSMCGYCI